MAVSLKQIAMLYIALFGRAPEGEGLNYWYEQAQANGWDLAELAEAMYEAALQYPEYAELSKPFVLVSTIYENVLGKTYADDHEGINYWVKQVKEGKIPAGEVAKVIIGTALTQYPEHPATKTLLNRAELGLKVAEKIEHFEGDFTPFQEIIKLVNDDPASIEQALAYLEGGSPEQGSQAEQQENFDVHSYLNNLHIDKVAENLPVALEEVFSFWNVGEANYGDWKSSNGMYNIFSGTSIGGDGTYEVHVKETDSKVFLNSEYNHLTIPNLFNNLVGGVSYELSPIPSVPEVKAEVKDDVMYSDPNADYYLKFERGFKVDIVGETFDFKDWQEHNYQYKYHGVLTLKEASGTVEVNDLEVRIKELSGEAVNLKSTVFNKGEINLTGTIVINGEEYHLETQDLKVNHPREQGYSELIITGEIILTDEEGHQIELDYQNADPHTTDDNLVGVSVDGEFYDDFPI